MGPKKGKNKGKKKGGKSGKWLFVLFYQNYIIVWAWATQEGVSRKHATARNSIQKSLILENYKTTNDVQFRKS